MMSIKKIALQTIQIEADSISALLAYVDDGFEKATHAINNCKGRLVVSGIGKSAIISQKIVATFNSTGTPSLYMHAADAIHGDLGMVQPSDVVLLISKSGNSPEIKVLVPLIKNFGNTLIGMVGNTESFLATEASITLNTTVQQEACPNNLAPTSSTTAQMVMGDALAVCLMQLKGFNGTDFAKYHPGGTLGRQLYLRVSDMLVGVEPPKVLPNATLKEVIVEITARRLGATAVVNEAGILQGIITDGDLRRMLEKTTDFENLNALHICTPKPKTIAPNALAIAALEYLRNNDITQLVVCNEQQLYHGIVHLHDLLREGLV